MEFLEWIVDQLTILAEAFGEALTEQRQEIYCTGLVDIPQSQLETAFRRARYELKWFPKLAELRELAGVLSNIANDGRPGPEEAWARMPKGERIEQDSIVWCEEEQAAYNACRTLLLDGDQIGARMAFKERYEKELASARSQQKPVRWTVSAGFDINSRLSTLALAIQEKRLSLPTALNFVPGECQSNFAQLLPPDLSVNLLEGKTEKVIDLPGLPGILAKMRIEEILPDELKVEEHSPRKTPASRSEEEVRVLREKANAQVEFLKRSRPSSKS